MRLWRGSKSLRDVQGSKFKALRAVENSSDVGTRRAALLEQEN
jgi:hypothetical protein